MPDPNTERFTDAPRIVFDEEGFQIDPSTGERIPNGGRVDPKTGATLAVPVDPDTGTQLNYD